MKVLAFLAFAFLAGCSVHAGTDGGGGDSCDCNVKVSENNCTTEYHASSNGELCDQLEDNNRDKCGNTSSRQSIFEGHSCGRSFSPHY